MLFRWKRQPRPKRLRAACTGLEIWGTVRIVCQPQHGWMLKMQAEDKLILWARQRCVGLACDEDMTRIWIARFMRIRLCGAMVVPR